MPFGPRILWAARAKLSAKRQVSGGNLPSACTASTCNVAPSSCATSATASSGWSTPVSWLAAINAATEPRGKRPSASRYASGSSRPLLGTGIHSTGMPRSASCSATRVTEGCSRRLSARPGALAKARLLASVPPEVNSTSRAWTAQISAKHSRASSTRGCPRPAPQCEPWPPARSDAAAWSRSNRGRSASSSCRARRRLAAGRHAPGR